jgi:hypothetical protein
VALDGERPVPGVQAVGLLNFTAEVHLAVVEMVQLALFVSFGPVALGHSHQRVQVHLNFLEKT